MSAAVPTIGYGLTLAYAPSGSTTFTSLGSIQDVKMPTATSDVIKVQLYDSATTDGTKIAGWGDCGDLEFELLWDHTVAPALVALRGPASNGYQWKVTKVDTHGATYIGFIQSYTDPTPKNNVMTYNIKIAVATFTTF